MSKIIGELNAAGICGSTNTANMTGTIGNGIVKYDSSTELYTGEYNVVPKAAEEQRLPCAGKKMKKDVTVQRVPYYETSNDTGITVYIASEV
nr:MAG TPA: hypothetical protein [Caudoviricetes sp.]